MVFLAFILVFYGAFLIGAIGFPQIVGTLKFLRSTPAGRAAFTITFWLIILGFCVFAVLKWLNDYAVSMYIAFAITFLASLNTRPD